MKAKLSALLLAVCSVSPAYSLHTLQNAECTEPLVLAAMQGQAMCIAAVVEEGIFAMDENKFCLAYDNLLKSDQLFSFAGTLNSSTDPCTIAFEKLLERENNFIETLEELRNAT